MLFSDLTRMSGTSRILRVSHATFISSLVYKLSFREITQARTHKKQGTNK